MEVKDLEDLLSLKTAGSSASLTKMVALPKLEITIKLCSLLDNHCYILTECNLGNESSPPKSALAPTIPSTQSPQYHYSF